MTQTSLSMIDVADHRIGSWRLRISREGLPTDVLARGYDHAAPRWNRILRRVGAAGAYDQMLRAVLAGHGAADRIDLLDAGTGTGALALAAHRVAGPRVQLSGCDVSGGMLRRARVAARRAGVRARFEVADITALPQPAASFDVSVVAHVLEHLSQPEQGLAEMIRVTRPGGRVMVCATRPGWAGRLIQLKWRTRLISPDSMGDQMQRAGLVDVRPIKVAGHRRFNALSYAFVGRVPSGRQKKA